jgi:hypothetical protein
MPDLESALAVISAEIGAAQKTVDALSKLLKRLRQAAEVGHIGDLEKLLAQAAPLGRDAESAVRGLTDAWSFDTKAHLNDHYADELRDEAERQGVKLFERDGRLFAFPLFLTIDLDEAALRIGRKLERRIRPRQVAKLLAASQRRPQALSEQRFLDLLYKIYERIVRSEWRKVQEGLGPVVPLAEIHSTLTLLPGSNYPIEQFGRDLLLLDRKPALRTREGHKFRFPGSALARERSRPIKIFDEEGRERTYLGLAFEKDP